MFQYNPWRSLPELEKQEGLTLTGTLIYRQSFQLRPALVRHFQQILAQACLFDGPGKHPTIEADWDLVQQNGETHHYSRILLFRDSANEAASPEHGRKVGLLFYRQDSVRLLEHVTDPREITHCIHIPGHIGQYKLLSAYEFLHDLTCGRAAKLNVIHHYLTTILDDPQAWITRGDLADL